jgi:tetratricopeptide (TPR) repeat protein
MVSREVPENSWDHAMALGTIAYPHSQLGNYAEAERLLNQALVILGHLEHGDGESYAAWLDLLGWIYLKTDRLPQAEEAVRRALTLREDVLGKDHVGVAVSLYHLGLVLQDKREYGKAEECYLRSLRISDAGGRRPRREMIKLLSAMASLFRATDQPDKAGEYEARLEALRQEGTAGR